MTAREAYARLVYEDATMQSLGFVQDRVWASNALDTPPRTHPFIVINSDGDEKVFGTTGRDTVSYWVHVPKEMSGDYNLIDLAIEQIKMLMEEVVHLVGNDGWSLTSATWIDTSRDLTDDAFNTIVKFVTFQAATRSLVTP
jgi:hypothetical protein